MPRPKPSLASSGRLRAWKAATSCPMRPTALAGRRRFPRWTQTDRDAVRLAVVDVDRVDTDAEAGDQRELGQAGHRARVDAAPAGRDDDAAVGREFVEQRVGIGRFEQAAYRPSRFELLLRGRALPGARKRFVELGDPAGPDLDHLEVFGARRPIEPIPERDDHAADDQELD